MTEIQIPTTVKGKTYLVSTPWAYETSRGIEVVFYYFSTRDGKQFGAVRAASNLDKPQTIGGQLFSQSVESFNVNVEAMLTEVRIGIEGNGMVSSPSVKLIER